MGVTIHFEGSLKSAAARAKVLAAAKKFATKRKWKSKREAGGVILTAHANCEPVRLVFDEDLGLNEFVKTQFAPVEVHVGVCELLKAIAPHFAELEVFDEGEYYETEDRDALEDELAACFAAMAQAKKRKKGLEGPVRLPSGKILDLVEG